MKRIFLSAAAVMLSALAVSPAAFASGDYPNKPIKIIVPYPPGGTSDVLGRLLGNKLSNNLKQPVIIENKPGAAEAIGASATATAPADGYTLMLATLSSMAVNPALYKDALIYNPQKDFRPIAHIASVPAVMAVNPKVPAKNLSELTAYFKANPNSSYASPGVGSPGHLGMEMYKQNAGINVLHVPYRGGAPAMQDLISGQVDAMLVLVPEGMPHHESGRVRALAISTLERSGRYPDLPTMSEAGLKDFEIFLWYTLVAPKGTPDGIVNTLNDAINVALKDDEIVAKLKELSIEPEGGSPEDAVQLVNQEAIKWKKLIDARGITAQ
ncbi:tripartite tricarboxylate transporter substrate binding protein [Candidimonas sp. SYP-B2681]|uniref:Bug family tripartite tricarboxylate transporter substrate binding protein n=1 Tax=Candidimonas sp. SYP-B2681 TaxID=2497686 RepID=UPI000F85CE7C|nr:tripartite tricarboxylate transporter substrate binding protein [Candidimonas sp. SYP-B2681]RTZ45389.1 tripartite tricarboxylate transporter substrate binding protein [Candidimonas sp. SYP-B2681]